jgi:hypothetical protein
VSRSASDAREHAPPPPSIQQPITAVDEGLTTPSYF